MRPSSNGLSSGGLTLRLGECAKSSAFSSGGSRIRRKAVLAFDQKRQSLPAEAVAYEALTLQRKCLSEPVKPRSVFK